MSCYWAFDLSCGATTCWFEYQLPATWNGVEPFTFSFWMWVEDPTHVAESIFSIGDRRPSNGRRVFSLAGHYGNERLFGAFTGFVAGAVEQAPWIDLVGRTCRWIHFAVTYDDKQNEFRIYVDGKASASYAPVAAPPMPGPVSFGATPFKAFYTPQTNVHSITGLIDEVRMWDVAFDADRIVASMYGRLVNPQDERGLISYVNVPPGVVQGIGAPVPSLEDHVSGQKVSIKPGVQLIPASIPDGGALRLALEGEAVLFSDPDFQGHSWLLGGSPDRSDARGDLRHCSPRSMRVGPNTVVTLFSEVGGQGVTQQAVADLPNFGHTRLMAAADVSTPLSVRIDSTRDRVSTAPWAIGTSQEGVYLCASLRDSPGRNTLGLKLALTTTSCISAKPSAVRKPHEGLLAIEPLDQPLDDPRETAVAIYAPSHEGHATSIDDWFGIGSPATPFAAVEEGDGGNFSLRCLDDGRWLTVGDDRCRLSSDREARGLFRRAICGAEDEGQVPELQVGDIAFYAEPGYWGRAWVFREGQPDLAKLIEGFAPQSIRLGPSTLLTLSSRTNDASGKGTVDFLVDVPELIASDFGKAAPQSFTRRRIVAPGAVGLEWRSELSEDLWLVDGRAERYAAYRTSLRLPKNVHTVYVGVTEDAVLAIDGQAPLSLTAGEALKPVSAGATGRLIISSEATGLATAGLVLRTDTMARNAVVTLFPATDVHTRLATLSDGELYAAEVHGKRILREGVSVEGAANAQNAIKAMMRSVRYTEEKLDAQVDGGPVSRLSSPGMAHCECWEWKCCSESITHDCMENEGWSIAFDGSVGLGARATSTSTYEVLAKTQVQEGGGYWKAETEGPFWTEGLTAGHGVTEWWKAVVSHAEQVVRVVVRKAVDLVDRLEVQIQLIGDRVKNFVIDTATKAAAVAQAVLAKIASDVAMVVDWLSFLFDWHDIRVVQARLARDIDRTLTGFSELILAQKPRFENGVDQFSDYLVGIAEELKGYFATKPIATNRQLAASRRHPAAEEKVHWFLEKFSSPSVLAYDTGVAIGMGGPPEAVARLIQGIEALLDDEIQSTLIRSQLGQARTYFYDAFNSDANMGLDMDQFMAGIVTVLEIGIEVALDFAKVVVGLLFELVADAVLWVREALEAPIDLGPVHTLWDLVTADNELGELKLNLLNLMTLGVSIPTTVIYKAISGKSPANVADYEPLQSGSRADVAAPLDEFHDLKLFSAIVSSCFAIVGGELSLLLDAESACQMAAKVSKAAGKKVVLIDPGQESKLATIVPKRPAAWAEGFDMAEQTVSRLEWIAWGCDFGGQVFGWPGGFPLAKPINGEFFPVDDQPELLADVLWFSEWGLLVLNAVAIKWDVMGRLLSKRQLRRKDDVCLVADNVLALLHLGLALAVWHSEANHKDPWYLEHVLLPKSIATVAGLVPDVLAFLQLPVLTIDSEGVTLAAYLALEAIATDFQVGLSMYMGIAGLIDTPAGANFSASTTSGLAGTKVSFTDRSTGPVSSWSWEFVDGAGTQSQRPNPEYTYLRPGVYTVTLTVTPPGTDSVMAKQRYITITGRSG
ncbi:Protease 1 precursor [Planctomycetes bacterium Pla133]|uniref:Protease 1 n=1 Tax=Engelhardtia mirabilis TaxID=2528011 RepID=A0A518BGT1_9BACT|nr:Protease 1 precursor [Planctomycetes bacterium Pla133]